ncbi:MAG: Ribosomal protein L11 methyltransferase [Firmicutes bacterium]|nr:Ribosomal protein L11 methyltransferase [Bacillota bacterium]MDI6704787.1 50S ribosomal protein L11 methyltransferase [Bacillota bacterium]
MRWMELAVTTNNDGMDLVSNLLYEAGIMGVVIEDPADIKDLFQDRESWDYVDPGLIKADSGEVTVKGYLPFDDTLHDRIEMIMEELQILKEGNAHLGCLSLETGEVEEDDWAESWKKYYKPIKIGQNIIIKPSWEMYVESQGDIVIDLDPGMAFGTGTHESTSLCIELLEKYVKPGHRVLDIGCGSGILAITAAKLGAGEVEAYDIQELAVRIAADNVKRNNVSDVVKVDRGNLFDRVAGDADIIVANIVADVIIKMSESVEKYLKPGGVFIVSGIIRERMDEVAEVLESKDMMIIEKLLLNGWGALAACMKGQKI